MIDGTWITANWGRPVVETIEFRTQIFTSRTRREQRVSRRAVPRRSVEFTALESDHRKMSRFLSSRGISEIELRDFSKSPGVLALATAPGLGTLEVSEVVDWMTVGRDVVVCLDDTTIPTTITAVSGTELTVSVSFAISIPVGSLVYPTVLGHFDAKVGALQISDTIAEWRFKFAVTPGSETVSDVSTTGVTFPMVSGRPVLNQTPNWVNGLDSIIEIADETVDYDIGVNKHFFPSDVESQVRQCNFLEATAVRQMFIDMRGRAGEFFFSTDRSDMTLVANIPAGASRIRVADTDAVITSVNSFIAIELFDGTIYYRDATSITSAPLGTRYLNLTETFPIDVSRDVVLKISWLKLCRFSVDALTVEWLTDTLNRITVPIQTLEVLQADP